MEKPEIETPELSVLRQLNEITASRFRPIKSNLTKISALFKAGFTEEEIVEVIQLKTVQWKKNPVMSPYLRPSTLFRDTNFENYRNEVEQVKANPELYAAHFAALNGVKRSKGSAADDADTLAAMFG